MLSAVIFDFDGIIVDTEPIHYKAFQEILVPRGLGYSWEEYLDRYIGFDDRDAFRAAFQAGGRSITAEELRGVIGDKARAFQKVIANGVEPYPGVVELVRSIAGNLPLGLCSGALAADIGPIVHQLGIATLFDVVVTADDVAASKPDPASYRLAQTRLADRFPDSGVTPATSLAIEDTPAGIASATGAGLKVLAVTNSYPEEKLGGALRVVNSLAGIDLEGLSLLF
ncbi:MAG TPA: HAD family phosphatase [Geobacteraceae bacterium]|nr:HAD family phosphatase [Geobacteraceae bacterium]